MKEANGLLPGAVFVYQGPPRGLLRRRGIAPGRILGLEAARGIVHVRTLLERADGKLDVDIGFMPILISRFRNSLVELGAVAPVPMDSLAAITVWQTASAGGEAGAFSCEIWEAEKLAWDTVQQAGKGLNLENTYIEYAFPKRSARGVYDVVVASAVRREGRGGTTGP